MAVVVLTVHDVGSPGEQADVFGYFLNSFCLGVDDDDGVLGRIGKIEFLVLRYPLWQFRAGCSRRL